MRNQWTLWGAVGAFMLSFSTGCGPGATTDDGTPTAIDEENYALRDDGFFWPLDHTISWRFIWDAGISVDMDVQPAGADPLTAIRTAVQSATNTWMGSSNVLFGRKDSGPVDIEIKWGTTSANAWASTNESSHDITLNKNGQWSVHPVGVANGRADLESVVLHELGHSIGLWHSSASQAVMAATISPGTPRRSLSVDDKVAVSVHYDIWTSRGPNNARDVGAGLDGSIWITTTDQLIKKWTGTTFSGSECCGDRVAVDFLGEPWIVARDGTIWHRLSSAPGTANWDKLPGCATDIGVGGLAGHTPTVYVLGCEAPPNGPKLYKWNAATRLWSMVPGVGTRLSVAENTDVWLVTAGTQILALDHRNGTWTNWGNGGIDVGVGPRVPQFVTGKPGQQDINYPFVTAIDETVWTVNYQSGDPKYVLDPSRATWFEIADPMARGTSIAVLNDGSPVTAAPSGGGLRYAFK